MSYERSPTDRRDRAPKLSRVTDSRLPSALRWTRRPFAVDVGGTKLAAGIVARRRHARARGSTRRLRSTSTPTRCSRRSPASSIGSTRRDAVAVGVGCGGPMDRGGEHVSPLNIPAWRGFPLRARLAAHTGLPGVGRQRRQGARARRRLDRRRRGRAPTTSAMVVSTGVGGGIVLDGRLLDGADGNAGHIGHVIVEPDGRECACGARGCLEAEASGIGDRAHHRRARRPRRRSRCASAPARSSAARSRRSPTCSTCRSRS